MRHVPRSLLLVLTLLAVGGSADDDLAPILIEGEATAISEFGLVPESGSSGSPKDESPTEPAEQPEETPSEFRVRLVGGDELRGELVGVENDSIRWALGTGDEVVIPQSALDRVDRGDGTFWTPDDGPLLLPQPPEAPVDAVVEPIVEPPPPLVVEAAVPFPLLEPKIVLEKACIWTQRIELGGQFIDGNSESDSLNLAGKFGQESDRRKSELEFGGFLGSADGIFATNRWFANATFDFNRPKSARWLLFVTSRNEYDQFENLDYRGTLSGGVGYRFVVENGRLVLFRLGPGVTGEFYRDPYRERITPDIFAQLEVKWPLFDRLTFENTTTFNPAIDDSFTLQNAFEVYRITSRTGLVLPLDEDETWNLKFGFRFDHDSQPNANRVPSDYTTTITIVYQRKK